MLTATTEWSYSATNDTTKNYYPKHVAVQNVWYYQPNNTIATYRHTEHRRCRLEHGKQRSCGCAGGHVSQSQRAVQCTARQHRHGTLTPCAGASSATGSTARQGGKCAAWRLSAAPAAARSLPGRPPRRPAVDGVQPRLCAMLPLLSPRRLMRDCWASRMPGMSCGPFRQAGGGGRHRYPRPRPAPAACRVPPCREQNALQRFGHPPIAGLRHDRAVPSR